MRLAAGEDPLSAPGSRASSLLLAAVLAPLAFAAFFWNLDGYSLANGDEAFYQAVAERMVESGDWFTVEFRGRQRTRDAFLNAPYHYWGRAVLIATFGSNLWTARILSAVFSTGVLVLMCCWTKRLAGVAAAFCAGLLLLTCYQFVFLHGARTGELEPLVAFFLLMAALTFARAIERGSSFLSHHMCVLVLFGLKSPLVLIPLVADLVLLLGSSSGRGRLADWAKVGAMVLPFGLIWPLIQWLRLGDSSASGVESMIGSAAPRGQGFFYAKNVRYYIGSVLAGAFPWGFFTPFAIASWLRSSRLRQTKHLVLLVYPAVLVCFYILIRKNNPWYMNPLYPFLAMVTGIWIAGLARSRPPSRTVLVVGVGLALAALIELPSSGLEPFRQIAAQVELELGWRAVARHGMSLAVMLAALTTATALLWRASRASPLVLPASIVLVVLGLGGSAMSSGLKATDHQSELLKARLEIDRKLLAGEELDFPVRLPSAGGYFSLYYFGDEFVVSYKRRRPKLLRFRELPRDPVTGEVQWSWLGHPGRVR